MASEGEQKPAIVKGSKVNKIIPILRLLAFFATLSATLVMALNKQTKSITVAVIGTVPIQATLTAKFQHTPAFVFFVITNANSALHNLLMLVVTLMGKKIDLKGHAPLVIAVLDMINVAVISAGSSAAIFMGQLGRDGNSHARWNKICDKFETYCDHGRGAMIASSIGLLLMITVTVLSIIKLKNKHVNYAVIP